MSWTTICKLALSRTFVGSVLRHAPLVERTYAWHTFRRRYHAGLFTGVYPTYEEAQKKIPAVLNGGWDNEQAAKMWVNQVDYMQPTAYAPFFWLSELLREGTTLIDYGGSIGLSYYSYVRRKELPPQVRWIVVEVPQLVASGKKVAEQQQAVQLEFVSDLSSAPQCDILFSAGALQYIEHAVPGFLERLPALPRHIVLNKVPVTKGKSYWTLENFSAGITPYRIFNATEFLSYFTGLGYVVRDSWEVPDLSLDVPFHPGESVLQFSGFYMERAAIKLASAHVMSARAS